MPKVEANIIVDRSRADVLRVWTFSDLYNAYIKKTPLAANTVKLAVKVEIKRKRSKEAIPKAAVHTDEQLLPTLFYVALQTAEVCRYASYPRRLMKEPYMNRARTALGAAIESAFR